MQPVASMDKIAQARHDMQTTNFPSQEALISALLTRKHPRMKRQGLFTLRNYDIPPIPAGAQCGQSESLAAVVSGGRDAAVGMTKESHKESDLHIMANSLIATCHIGVFLPEDEEGFWGVRLAAAWSSGKPNRTPDLDINVLMWRAWTICLIDDDHRASMMMCTLSIMREEGLDMGYDGEMAVDSTSHGSTVSMLVRMLVHHIGGRVMRMTLEQVVPTDDPKRGLLKSEVAALLEHITVHTMERPGWVT